MQNDPLKIYCFTGAVNFMEFCSGLENNEFNTFISPLQDQYKTYVNACCNKATWLKLLKTGYSDFLNNNKNNPLWAIIKERVNSDKLMFLENDKELIII